MIKMKTKTKAIRSSMTPKPYWGILLGMRKKTNLKKGGAGLWILVVILIIGAWVGFKLGRFYFDHKTIENEIAVIGDDAITTHTNDPKQKILDLMTAYSAHVDPDKISVEPSSDGRRVSIRFSYTRDADFLIFQSPVSYDVYVQRDAGKAAGVVQSVQDSITDSNATADQKYKTAIQNATKPKGNDAGE
jgi:hypothetical protein